MSVTKPPSTHAIELAARKHTILASYEVEKALRQLAQYPGGPPTIMRAERSLMDIQRLLNMTVEDLKPNGAAG
ncbi:hypothetical protein [uncultured Ruegeria sp.]|uniref:hypothetical protein n=1 Tax=uncultured Ruegeria sp. TaxID=259304 RepID=UPI00147BDAA9|nr:hypothetical protein [uncultured Ruegeria sp.]